VTPFGFLASLSINKSKSTWHILYAFMLALAIELRGSGLNCLHIASSFLLTLVLPTTTINATTTSHNSNFLACFSLSLSLSFSLSESPSILTDLWSFRDASEPNRTSFNTSDDDQTLSTP
jgi:glycopeptide antibiotics resistance protein